MPPEQRRKSIIKVALPLLSGVGESLVVSDVAAAAGVAEATVFKVFPTRDALIQACLESATDTSALVAAFNESRSPAKNDLHANLLSIAEPLREYFLNALGVISAIGSPKANDLARGTKELFSRIDQLIAEEFKARDLFQRPSTPPVAFALVFVSSIFALASRELAEMPTPSTSELVEALVNGADSEK